MSGEDGFLSRWSRRKTAAREAPAAVDDRLAPPPDTPPQAPVAAPPAAATQGATDAGGAAASSAHTSDHEPAVRLPTMDDVARLTAGSDFSAYVAPGVDESVKNAAMKKLFSDPRYNVMDGLDVYIDDYSRPDPIPPDMLRKMHQSKLLRLFDDEADEADKTAEPAPDAALAQAPPPATEDPPEAARDEDPDLRLQQDDAAGRPEPAPGARA